MLKTLIFKFFKKPHYFPLFSIIALIFFWYLHVLLTELNDPLGLPFDFIIGVIFSSIFKISVFLSIIILYFQIIPLLYKNKINSAFYFIFNFGFSLTIILLLTYFRNGIARIFNNDAIKYYYFLESGNYQTALGDQVSFWAISWSKGVVLLKEILLILVIILFNTLIGYFIGKRKKLAAIICILTNLAILIGYNILLGFYYSSFDEFFGDIYSAVLLFDIILLPIPVYLFTSISILFYLIFILSAIFVYKINERKLN